MGSYKNLRVWQEARILTSEVYDITYDLPPYEMYSLADQMRRAAVSIGSNIAEGQGRGTIKEYMHFLYIARGSAYELDTQLTYCYDLGYSKKEMVESALKRVGLVSMLINKVLDSFLTGKGYQYPSNPQRFKEEVEPYLVFQTYEEGKEE